MVSLEHVSLRCSAHSWLRFPVTFNHARSRPRYDCRCAFSSADAGSIRLPGLTPRFRLPCESRWDIPRLHGARARQFDELGSVRLINRLTTETCHVAEIRRCHFCTDILRFFAIQHGYRTAEGDGLVFIFPRATRITSTSDVTFRWTFDKKNIY